MPSSVTPSGLAPSDGPLSMLTSADHLFVAIPALVFYEYVITFEQELAVVWRRKFTLVSLLLIVIRWTLLVEAVFLVLPQPSEDRCHARTTMVLVPIQITYTLTAVFSAVRIFAVAGKNMALFLLVLLLGLAPIVVNTFITAHAGLPLPFIGPKLVICPAELNITGSLQLALSISGRAPVILAEGVIIVVTWFKTFNGRHILAHLQDSMTLTQYILRDGTLFFIAMLILNTAMLIIIITDSNIGFTGPLMDILPPILISRFILNIRRSATRSGYTREESEILVTSQTMTGVVFRGVSAALDELGREIDDGQPYLTSDPPASPQRMSGLSNFLLFDRALSTPGDRSSWVTQTDHSSVDGHDTVTDESISGVEESHQ